MFISLVLLSVLAVLKLMALAGITAIVLKEFVFTRLRDWMRERHDLLRQNPDHVAVSIHDKLENGQYRTCYGIFDKTAGRFRDAEMLISEKVDAETERVHRPDYVTVYR